MRKNIVAGNWKMNTTVPEGVQLAKDVCAAVAAEANLKCDVIMGVPFTHLMAVKEVIGDANVGLAAQNCADHTSGAYTGEVSAPMVASTGANYVILGHSERRGYYHETCGESLEERENCSFKDVIGAEIRDSLFHLTAEQFQNIVIAYEPIWAIGTGKTATSDQAQEIHAFIRGLLADKFGAQVADDTTILYGGSCKPSNAPELFAKPDIDGGLIGGASLKAADFMGIVTAF